MMVVTLQVPVVKYQIRARIQMVKPQQRAAPLIVAL